MQQNREESTRQASKFKPSDEDVAEEKQTPQAKKMHLDNQVKKLGNSLDIIHDMDNLTWQLIN